MKQALSDELVDFIDDMKLLLGSVKSSFISGPFSYRVA